MEGSAPSLFIDIGDALVFQEEEAEEKLSEIWSPDLEIENEVEQRQTESVELRILRDGTVEYEERFRRDPQCRTRSRALPFDAQTLEIELQSFLWDQGDCVFVSNDEQTGFDPDFETPGVDRNGRVGCYRRSLRDPRRTAPSRPSPSESRRSARAGHYVLRFMVPLMFVMLLTLVRTLDAG